MVRGATNLLHRAFFRLPVNSIPPTRRDSVTASAIALIAIGLATSRAGEVDWRSAIAALRPADVSAQEKALLDNLERRAQRVLEAIPRARTRDAADRSRPELRRRLLNSLGLLHLPWPPDLRPQSVGTIRRDGYRIE